MYIAKPTNTKPANSTVPERSANAAIERGSDPENACPISTYDAGSRTGQNIKPSHCVG